MPAASSVLSREAIQSRMRRGYLERLELRARKMRTLLTERNWDALRVELLHIRNSAPTFGLEALALGAEHTLGAIGTSQARARAEEFLRKIDHWVEGTPPELLA